MHDCYGKPLKPFDRVRAATKEELEAQGHPEKACPTTLSPAEQFVLPASFGSETCNAHVVPVFQFAPRQPAAGALYELTLTVGTAYPQLVTARTLVKVEG